LPTGREPRSGRPTSGLDNAYFLGLIAAMLPGASLIYCRRDARDVAFACLSLMFIDGQDWSYSMQDIAAFWRAHERLMAHWRGVLPAGRLLEVSYEALVADPEPLSRRIVAHAGLEWNDAAWRRTRRGDGDLGQHGPGARADLRPRDRTLEAVRQAPEADVRGHGDRRRGGR